MRNLFCRRRAGGYLFPNKGDTRKGVSQLVEKVCHSEPVTDVTGVGIRHFLLIRGIRIATPVCALVRNDKTFVVYSDSE